MLSDGDPVYWDENSGPSIASNNEVGTVPSESFTVLGSAGTSTTGTTPEPGSILLFGSGILGSVPPSAVSSAQNSRGSTHLGNR